MGSAPALRSGLSATTKKNLASKASRGSSSSSGSAVVAVARASSVRRGGSEPIVKSPSSAVSTSAPSSIMAPPPKRDVVARVAETKWAAPTATGGAAQGHGLGIYINSHFDSGNIEVLGVKGAREHFDGDTPHIIDLKIHADPFCDLDGREHFQWFYYRVSSAKGERLQMRIVNAGDASFPEGWVGYQAVASYDRKRWFRVKNTTFDEATGVLTIDHTPEKDAVYYAYFAPYPYERHQALIAEVQASGTAEKEVALEMLGETLDGHDLDCIRVGPVEPGRPRVWVIARQHPGETQAEYFAEGLLRRLLDDADATGRAARAAATFFVVPNMNPDGSWRGHLRTNAAGVNLNRAWAESEEFLKNEAPEVGLVLNYMDEVGVDFLCDVHGDEALPAVFAAGCEGVPSFDDARAETQDRFYSTLTMMCPEFQTTVGYPRTAKGKANLSIAKNFIAERFGCVSMTLEMPFKDVETAPGEDGWTPQRSAAFGADYLGAILDAIPALKKKREAEDAKGGK